MEKQNMFDSLAKECDDVGQAIIVARIFEDYARQVDRQNKNLWRALIVCIVTIVLLVSCMVGAVLYVQNNAQTMLNDALWSALNTVTEIGVTQETTTTTTQTVEGDSATINNVEGEQYNDNATNAGGD